LRLVRDAETQGTIMHIHIGSIIIHALIYSLVYRLIDQLHLSMFEILGLGAFIVVGVMWFNRRSRSSLPYSRRRR
jgi:hypothetical protein